jgi:POT family proton-dependent oligopeptide transporter
VIYRNDFIFASKTSYEKKRDEEAADAYSTSTPREGYVTEKQGIIDTADGEEPTEEEKKTLRHVGEWLPPRVWLVAVVELCERFTYYGMQGLFQNYVSHANDGSDGSKGLGKFSSSNLD